MKSVAGLEIACCFILWVSSLISVTRVYAILSRGGKGYNNHHVGASTCFSILISPLWCLTLNAVCASENVFPEIIGIEITIIKWDEIE